MQKVILAYAVPMVQVISCAAMENDDTGQGHPEPLRAPAKKVWKSLELVVISANDNNLKADTWPGSGDADEQSKAPAFYKRVKAALPFKGVDE